MAFRISWFARRWKWPKVLIGLMIFELAGTVAVLALFGIADPNLFRTRLWQTGYDNGFNSDPKEILYAYANYRPIPSIPFVWSQTLTSFNLAISVLCTFILLCKSTMFILHIWYPILGAFVNFILTVLWCVSAGGQAGPDHSDPAHSSNVAWYVSKSCSYGRASGNEHYCNMAKATFACSVVMAIVFFANFVLSIWSLMPSAAQRAAARMGIDEMQKDSQIDDNASDQEWEMKRLRATTAQKIPYTPRTLAFNTLDRQLPLRSEQMGNKRWP